MVPMSECVNIMVTYVNGHETPPNCTVIFKCTTDTIEPQIKNNKWNLTVHKCNSS